MDTVRLHIGQHLMYGLDHWACQNPVCLWPAANFLSSSDQTFAILCSCVCGLPLTEEEASGQSEAAEGGAGSKAWEPLMRSSWCPVLTEAPSPYMPWPSREVKQLAPPEVTRPVEDAWLVSSCLSLLACNCSPALAKRLNWARPPMAMYLATQLVELGKCHQQVISPLHVAGLAAVMTNCRTRMTVHCR